ncbi:MAG: DUF3099 domain-containing protein [Frankiaceae bacterium]|jgi:hypothetical protein
MFSKRSPQRGRRDDDVYVVTNAGRSRREEIDDRQKKYLIKMAIRTLCLIGAIILYALHVPFVFILVLIIASTVLPWMSVVVANAGPGPERARRQPEVYSPDPARALRPGRSGPTTKP